jgi:hypothetical protein
MIFKPIPVIPENSPMLAFIYTTSSRDAGIDDTLASFDTSPYKWKYPGTSGPTGAYPGDDVLGFISTGHY